MDNTVFEISFPSDINLTKTVVRDILLFIEERTPHFSDISKNDVRLIFQELLVNSIVHGNKSDTCKKVYLRAEIDGDIISAKIADEGQGFNYTRLLSEFGNVDKLIFDHGRGIRLVCSLVDSFSFNSLGNEINFVIKLN